MRIGSHDMRRSLHGTRGRSLAFLVFLAGGLVLAWYARQALLLGFVGILFAILFRSLAKTVAKRTPLGDTSALVAVLVVSALLVAGASVFLAADISREVDDLAKRLPGAFEQIRGRMESNPIGKWVVGEVSRAAGGQGGGGSLGRVATMLSTAAGSVSGIVLALVMGLFLAFNPRPYVDGFVRLVPVARRARVREVLGCVREAMARWFAGKACTMTAIGVMTWLGLSLIGVGPALTLGLFAGAISIIPYFGPVLSGIPAMLLGFVESPGKGVAVIALFAVVQFIEGNLLTPLVERKTVWVPPALTLLTQLVFGILFGLLGVLVAPPLVATVLIATRMLYVEDVLESPIGRPIPEGRELPSDGSYSGVDREGIRPTH